VGKGAIDLKEMDDECIQEAAYVDYLCNPVFDCKEGPEYEKKNPQEVDNNYHVGKDFVEHDAPVYHEMLQHISILETHTDLKVTNLYSECNANKKTHLYKQKLLTTIVLGLTNVYEQAGERHEDRSPGFKGFDAGNIHMNMETR